MELSSQTTPPHPAEEGTQTASLYIVLLAPWCNSKPVLHSGESPAASNSEATPFFLSGKFPAAAHRKATHARTHFQH
eukprot:925884-Pelagomonas_calceolata.AAC.2